LADLRQECLEHIYVSLALPKLTWSRHRRRNAEFALRRGEYETSSGEKTFSKHDADCVKSGAFLCPKCEKGFVYESSVLEIRC